MATNYPTSLDSYSTKVDNVTDVLAAHVNNLQDAVVAIETELGIQPRHSTTTAPTVNDDTAYSIGTIWTDTTNDRIYICIDNTNGAAIWQELSVNYIKMLTASNFDSVDPTPALGSLVDGSSYGTATWRLDDAASEGVGCSFEYKGGRGGSTIYMDMWWAAESAAAGNVDWRFGVSALATGEDATAGGGGQVVVVAVPGTAKYLKRTTFTASVTYTVADMIMITVTRRGASGDDTAAGDMHFVCCTVRFA